MMTKISSLSLCVVRIDGYEQFRDQLLFQLQIVAFDFFDGVVFHESVSLEEGK